MSPVTVPVSMIASKGSGGAIAAGVIGLLILLALAAKNSTASNGSSLR
jgi:hypothetical protein